MEAGLERIRKFFEEQENLKAVDASPELSFLTESLEEIPAQQPLSKLEKMQPAIC